MAIAETGLACLAGLLLGVQPFHIAGRCGRHGRYEWRRAIWGITSLMPHS